MYCVVCLVDDVKLLLVNLDQVAGLLVDKVGGNEAHSAQSRPVRNIHVLE